VSTLVVDASIVVKWVVEEDGTPQALILRRQANLIAPDLLIAECANILWKKVQRDELCKQEALLAARLLQATEIELLPTRSSMEAATRIAIELDHPAYECIYLALAIDNGCKFVTADQRLLRKLDQRRQPTLRACAISLTEAAEL
jgi:predicted nucleic acid-binding protein